MRKGIFQNQELMGKSSLKKHQLTIIFFLLLSLTKSSLANTPSQPEIKAPKESIIWLYEDSKENYSLLNYPQILPDVSASPSVYTEQLILIYLKQYNFKLQPTSVKRINVEIKNSKNTCAANRIKTKAREQFSVFSTPQNIYLSHKLYRLAKDVPPPISLFNKDGKITSLADFFRHYQELVLGIGDDVSYGNFIDDEIDKVSKKNIYHRGGSDHLFALTKMMFAKRINFILSYPDEIKLNLPKNLQLESYSIAGSTPYILGHFTCSNSELGKRVINDINKILAREYLNNDFHQVYKNWLLPEDMPELDKYFSAEFGKK